MEQKNNRKSIFDGKENKQNKQAKLHHLLPSSIKTVNGNSIIQLNKEVKRMNEKLTVKDLFNLIRYQYYETLSPELKAHIKNTGIEAIKMNLEEKEKRVLLRIIEKYNLDWTDLTFHLKYRVQTFEALMQIFGEDIAKGTEAFADKYLLSILPLNLSLPQEVLTKFIPPVDYFDVHLTGTIDPYGIWMKGSLILDKEGKFIEKNGYLASRKFKDVILVNITDNCPIGCAGCYKSPLVREKNGELREQFNLITDEKRVLNQIRGVVEWLNQHPEVNSIVISGGEPLTYTNEVYKRILSELEHAKYLKIVRICTATIFQGLPFRIDDELLELLKKFNLTTGKRIAFNAHISNHHQITPEALVAAKKIKDNGFDILLQMPVQRGINFFAKNKDDKEGIRKTIEYFTKISQMANAAGLQNYKWIVDMHPRTQERVVPIELLLDIFSKTFEKHEYSDMTRPNYLELLCRQGNVYLGKDTLENTAKRINYEIDTVTYFIRVEDRVILHREPLIKGVNDNEIALISHDNSHDKLQLYIEKYIEHVLPIEKKIKEVMSSDLSADEKNILLRKLKKELEETLDVYFPPIIGIDIE
jgi:lysine 2,3-aminomutase